MMGRAVVESNEHFRLTAKRDIVLADSDIQESLLRSFRTLLRTLFAEEAPFPNLKLVNRLPFNYKRFEFDYPNDTQFSSCFSKSSLRRQLNKTRLYLAILTELISYQKNTFRKRELYYRNTDNFVNQEELDEALKTMFFALRIRRSQLRVFNAPKGLVFGPLTVRIEDALLSFGNSVQKSSGTLISFEDFEIEENRLNFVLIVEKETVFSSLLNNGFTDRFPNCLLVTGKGYPDYTTKRFIRRLVLLAPQCPFLYLGDLDPHGIDIFLNYLFSTPMTVFENSNVPTLFPIGIDRFDIETALRNVDGIAITSDDIVKATNMLQLPYFRASQVSEFPTAYEYTFGYKLAVLERNLQFVLEKLVKFEVEHLEANRVSLIDFVAFKLWRLFDWQTGIQSL